MRITENRVLAWVLCVACLALSIFGFGGLKLKGRYSDVGDVFLNGSDPKAQRHNMKSYVERCAEYASEMAYEAMQYLTDSAPYDAVLEYAELAMNDSGSYDSASAQNLSDLNKSVEVLYSALQKAKAEDDEQISVAYNDYKSVKDMIKRDKYHDAAEKYGDLIDSFPADILAGIWGIDDVGGF